MGGIVHCDAGSDGQQHLLYVEDVNAIKMLEDDEELTARNGSIVSPQK